MIASEKSHQNLLDHVQFLYKKGFEMNKNIDHPNVCNSAASVNKIASFPSCERICKFRHTLHVYPCVEKHLTRYTSRNDLPGKLIVSPWQQSLPKLKKRPPSGVSVYIRQLLVLKFDSFQNNFRHRERWSPCEKGRGWENRGWGEGGLWEILWLGYLLSQQLFMSESTRQGYRRWSLPWWCCYQESYKQDESLVWNREYSWI